MSKTKKLSVEDFYQQFHNEGKHDQENENGALFSHMLAPNGHPIGAPLDFNTLRKPHARAAEQQLLSKADIAKKSVDKAALLATLRKKKS